jgi:hypothetical protein
MRDIVSNRKADRAHARDASTTGVPRTPHNKEFDMFEQITKFANEATTNVTDALSENSERFTTTSNQVLDAVLDANRRIVDAAVTTADRINEQVKFDLPFVDRLPTPTVAGERYLEFVERAVSLNRDFNQRVVEMITADNTKAPARKAAPKKATARKAPARKAAPKKATARKRPARKTVAKKAAASQ